jgi:hypothetical protein
VFCVGNSSELCSVYGYPTGIVSSVQETILNCVLYIDILQEYCVLLRNHPRLYCVFGYSTGIVHSV